MEPTNQIDRLTLELLTSRKQYRQYLKHTDTQKYLEQTGFIRKVRKYESEILGVIHELLSDPEKPITNEISDTFIPFIQAIFKHIDNTNAEYNDTLFDHFERSGGDDDEEEEEKDRSASMAAAHSKDMIQYSMQMFMKPNQRFMQKQKERRFSNRGNDNLRVENNMSNEYRENAQELETENIYAEAEPDEYT